MKNLIVLTLLLILVLPAYIYPADDSNDSPASGDAPEFRTFKGHTEEVLTIALSPDGRMLASGGEDEIVILWNVSTGEKIRTLKGHRGHIKAVLFSPDGRTLASGSKDKAIVLWDPVSGEKIRDIKDRSMDSVLSLAFSPDGKVLAAGTDDEKVILLNPQTGQKIRTLEGHSDEIGAVAFSPDGKTLASGSGDKTIILWDPATGEKRNTLKGHKDTVNSLAFGPDSHVLVSSSSDKSIAFWNTTSGEKTNILTDNKDSVQSVAFSPDGRILVSGNEDKTITLWDAQTGNKLEALSGHKDMVTSVIFTPDGHSFISASEDRNINVWDTRDARLTDVFAGTAVQAPKHVPIPPAAVVPPVSAPAVKEPAFAVKAPVLAAPDLAYDVSVADANGNGIFEGGETVKVTVHIENRGKGAAQAVEILVSGNNSLIYCLGNSRVVGDVEPGGKRDVVLQCTLPTRIQAETAHLSLELAEQRGYSPAEIKSFTVAMKPAEIIKTEHIISRHIDVDVVPAKNSNFRRDNSYALVIGISNYRDPEIPSVKYAKSDAEKFAKYLENIGRIWWLALQHDIELDLSEPLSERTRITQVKAHD